MTLKPTCVTHQDFILGRKKRTCHEIHEALLSVPCPLSSCHRYLHCDQMSNICAPRLTQLVLLPAPVPSRLWFQHRPYALSLQPNRSPGYAGHPGSPRRVHSSVCQIRWRVERTRSPHAAPCAVSSASAPHAHNCRRSSKHGHLHVLGANFLESIFWEFSAELREVTTWPLARFHFLGHFDLFKGHSYQDSPPLTSPSHSSSTKPRSLSIWQQPGLLIKQRVSPAFSNLCPRGRWQCPLYSVHGILQFSHLSSKLSVLMCAYNPRTQEVAAGEAVQDQHGLHEILL